VIQTLLIANRGEIARRIIRTAKKMGIKTVAVYSDADTGALFAREADASIGLGGKTPLESYLDVEKVIGAALSERCDAVHPGYGFLSENPSFVRKCMEVGLLFVGPEAESIRLMGDKAQARRTAQTLGIATVPGSGIVRDLAEAMAACEQISFPVLLKASAGGGGIGMRRIENVVDLPSAFDETSARARVAFGDSRVYLEKYLDEPHHIEIQVFRDKRGNVLTFCERECSVQRRFQKVIEESPSTFVTADLRRDLRKAAKKLVNGIGYVNAGTVEFVVDSERNYYFLEANTRLQVEHPVTEAITGLDLVELQLRITAGEELSLVDDGIVTAGNALEARIYAEDPERFYPSPGTITGYEEPAGEGIRVDSGYCLEDTVTPYYDPLIAKLITHGSSREEARARMLHALDRYHISGIKTNIPFLKKAFSSPLFRRGGYDTHFVEKLKKEGLRC
jgi:acetyl-CoA carboxylase biotin carboxylase subunit